MMHEDVGADYDSGEFIFIKLKCDDTLFAEQVDSEDTGIIIRNPIVIKTLPKQDGADLLYGAEWLPYAESKVHKIPHDSIMIAEPLSDRYTKFYGSVVLNTLMTHLQDEARERIQSGEPELFVMHEILDRMDEVGEFLASKFDIDCPDFSDIRSKYKDKIGNYLH